MNPSRMPQFIANNLKRKIAKDFSKVYLTHNLVDTMNVELKDDGAVVHIPAVRYDFKEWNKNKAVVPHQEWGSYAEQVNVSGGFSGYHKNYIDLAIMDMVWNMRWEGLYLKDKKIVGVEFKYHYEPTTKYDFSQHSRIFDNRNARKEYMKKKRSKKK